MMHGYYHMPMMGYGNGLFGYLINLLVIGIVVYIAVRLAMRKK